MVRGRFQLGLRGSVFVSYVVFLAALASCGGLFGDSGGTLPDPGAAQPPEASAISLDDTLAQLASLETPASADSGVFAELKSQLASSLKATGVARFTAAVPLNSSSAVSDLAMAAGGDGSAAISFTYCNQGDYNEDSLVGVSDITPLGVNWATQCAGFPAGGFPADSTLAVVDGNANGLIEVGDITPIGQNYQCSVKGYALLASTSPSPSGNWQEVARVPFSASIVPESGKRRVFSFDFAAPSGGSYYRVQPYCDTELGVASNTVQFVLPVPVIKSVAPTSGKTGAEVTFSMLYSGAAPVTYSWDFGGGADPNSSGDAAPMVTLGAAGTYPASLIAGNDLGSDQFDFDLVVLPNTQPVAQIMTTASTGNAPLQVVLNASASSDSDGEIASFEWDFEGDGTWDEDTGTTALCDHTYASPGSYEATVRVCDDGGAADTASVTIDVSEPTGSWNFLIWMAADNNLAQAGFDDITEMEAIGSNDDVTILVGYDIDPVVLDPGLSGAETINFIKVVQDNIPDSINTTGDPHNLSFPRAGYNSADPANVVAFLEWAEANFPADRSVLVLWDHGSGWVIGEGGSPVRGGGGKPPGRRDTSGILCDDTDGTTGWDLTTNAAVIAALGDRHFDILAFDACNMGDVESLYDYAHLADWLIASQEGVPFDGFAYVETLTHWNAQLPDAEGIGRLIVDDYVAKYELSGASDVQLALYDTATLDELVNTLGVFAGLVEDNAEVEKQDVRIALHETYDVWAGGVRDLGGFLECYRDRTDNPAIQQAADDAHAAMGDVVVHLADYNMPLPTGISVFLPDEYWFEDSLLADYSGLQFNLDTDWLAMLVAAAAPPPPIEADWVPGDKLVISWADIDADVNLRITDPSGNYGSAWWPDEVADDVLFSLDSYDSGVPEEWVQLKAAAESGAYEIEIEWYWYEGMYPPSTIDVLIQLQTSGGSLKQDFGVFPLTQYMYFTPVILNN